LENDEVAYDDVEKPGGGSQPVLSSPRYCPGINNHAGYLCETGHCCGETGCCTYYYELWYFSLSDTLLLALCGTWVWHVLHDRMYNMRCMLYVYLGAFEYAIHTEENAGLSFLASFKLPSYEEVAARPNTPPPPYSTVFALQGGQYAQAGPSGMTSSQSSDNYTSCSCESCSASSPSSTSFSVQVTDETDTSHASTPSEAADSRPPSTDSPGAGAEPVCPGASQSPPKHALFSSNVDVFEPAGGASDAEDEDEAEADEGHYRHRRLTGDSGIEVCRCQVESEDEEEEEEEEGEQDSVDCTNRTQAPQPPQHCQPGDPVPEE
uniref:Si:ch73-290k24.6 n=1 Tax=Lepisosteus oculatus TaxID=7918 RepID=W5M2Z3_LEPOC